MGIKIYCRECKEEGMLEIIEYLLCQCPIISRLEVPSLGDPMIILDFGGDLKCRSMEKIRNI